MGCTWRMSSATCLKLAGFLIVAVTLIYSRAYLDQRDILRGEYDVLCLTALLGIFVLISANSLITVYMGVELLALSVYALIAFDRESGVAAEAAMKYFVLSAIASGTLLYGMSIIYGMTGSLDLDVIAARIQRGSRKLGSHLRPGIHRGRRRVQARRRAFSHVAAGCLSRARRRA